MRGATTGADVALIRRRDTNHDGLTVAACFGR